MCLHFRAMISKKSVAYFRNAYLFKLGLTFWGLWDRPQGLNGPLSSSYLKFITLSWSKINLNKNGNIFHRTYKTYLFQNQHSPGITYNSFQGLMDLWFRQFWDMTQTWNQRQWNGDITNLEIHMSFPFPFQMIGHYNSFSTKKVSWYTIISIVSISISHTISINFLNLPFFFGVIPES